MTENIEALKAIVEAEFRGRDEFRDFERALASARAELEAFNKLRGSRRGAGRGKQDAKELSALADAQADVARTRREMASAERDFRSASSSGETDADRLRYLKEEEKLIQSRIRQEEKEEAADQTQSERNREKFESQARLEALKREGIDLDRESRQQTKAALQERLELERQLASASKERFNQILSESNLQGSQARIANDELDIGRQLLAIDKAQADLARTGADEVEKRRKLTQQIEKAELNIGNTLQKNTDAVGREELRLAAAERKQAQAEQRDRQRSDREFEAARKRASTEAREAEKLAQRQADIDRQRLQDTEALGRAQQRFRQLAGEGTLGGGSSLSLQEQLNLQNAILDVERRRAAQAIELENASPFERQKARLDLLEREARITNTVNEANRRLTGVQRTLVETGREWLGTIGRIAAGLLVYEAGARSIEAVARGVAAGFEFANTVEIGERAIGGLLGGLGEVVDVQGRILSGQARLNALQEQGVLLTESLRIEAIGTVAEFDKLLPAFQRNLSIGVQAGLDLDEYEQVVSDITTGAVLFGVDQSNLDEEIRSLLTGAIRVRDSRVAVALGITNAEVNAAREAGRLYEFLNDELQSVRETGEDLRQTLPVVFSDLRDAALFALADGIRPLRSELTETLTGIREQVEDTGRFTLFPELVQNSVSPLVGILEDVTQGSVTFGLLASESLRLVLELAETLTSFFANSFVQGILGSFAVGLRAINRFLDGFQTLFRALDVDAARFAGAAAGGALAVRSLTAAGGALAATFSRIGTFLLVLAFRLQVLYVTQLPRLVAGLFSVGRALLTLTRRLILPVGAIFALSAAIDELLERSEGFRNFVGDTVEFFGGENPFANFTEGTELEGLGAAIERQFEAIGPRVAGLFDSLFSSVLGDSGAEEAGKETGSAFVAGLGDAVRAAQSLEEELEGIQNFSDQDLILSQIQQGGPAALRLAESAFEIDRKRLEAVAETARLEGQLRDERAVLQRGLQEGRLLRDGAVDARQRIAVLDRQLLDLANEQKLAREIAQDALQRQIPSIEAATRAEAEYNREITRTEAIRAAALTTLERGGPNSFGISANGNILFAEQLADLIEIETQVASVNVEIERQQALLLATQAAFASVGRLAGFVSNDQSAGAQSFVALQEAATSEIEEQIALNQRNLELLRAQANSVERQNSARTGLESAVNQQQRDLSDGAITNGLATDTFSNIRQGVGQAVGAALSGQDVDVQAGARALGQQIAADLGLALIERAIFQPLFDGIANALGLQIITPGETALVAALAANAVAVNFNTAVVGLLTQIMAARTALGLSGGGLVSQGRVLSFADGGRVNNAAALPFAPHDGDRRDRIPAFLRANEYVATPEMNSRTGGTLYPFLEKLRRGSLSIDTARFAHGGRVLTMNRGGAVPSTRSSASERSRRPREQTVVAVGTVLGSRDARNLFESRDSARSFALQRNARLSRRILGD